MKIKMIESYYADLEHFENEVNKFIDGKKIVDIKYQVFSNDQNADIITAAVMYEK